MLYHFIFILSEIAFLTIALMHLYWAFGAKSISTKVIPYISGMPAFKPTKSVTFFVGIIFFLLTIFIFALSYNWQSENLGTFYKVFGSLLALIFVFRAVGDFKLVGFFKKITDSQFAFYDTRYWSPFGCLLAFLMLYLTWYK